MLNRIIKDTKYLFLSIFPPFLVSLASHHEESEGDFTQNGGKIDRKRYFVSLMMRFSIQNVNYLVAHIQVYAQPVAHFLTLRC